MVSPIYDVIIIGSGVSGLYTAKLLKEKGYRVVVVESDQTIGGRTRQNTTFTQWNVELGGEMIHGQDTLYYQIAKENNWEVFEVFEEDLFNSSRKSTYFYLGREKKLVGPDQIDDDMKRLFTELTTLSDLKSPKKNENLLQHLVERGVPFRMIGLADAVYSKTWGTTLDRIGLKSASIEDKKFHKIPKNFKVQQSSKIMVDHFAKDLEIKVDWKVTSVDRSKSIANGGYVVVGKQGNKEQLVGKRVVVSVPLRILKDGDITFTPSLPADKQEAIRIMQMDGGMKIIAKFSRKFWKSGVELVLCGDSMVPQIWMDGAPQRPFPKGSQPEYVCVGFITGDQAVSVASLSPKHQIDGFLQQLNNMFGDVTNGYKPATDCFIAHTTYDWQKNNHVRGAYAFPCVIPSDSSIQSSPNAILSKKIESQIYFAGEATATEFEMGTINGALQTAVRTFQDIHHDFEKDVRPKL